MYMQGGRASSWQPYHLFSICAIRVIPPADWTPEGPEPKAKQPAVHWEIEYLGTW